jgi:hypothetical protein
MSLGNATFGGFIVGRASRLPSNDLPTQARRPRYIQKSKSKLPLVLHLHKHPILGAIPKPPKNPFLSILHILSSCLKNPLGGSIEMSASLKHRGLAESLAKPVQFPCCTSNSFFRSLGAFTTTHFEAFWGHKMVDPSQIRSVEQLEM